MSDFFAPIDAADRVFLVLVALVALVMILSAVLKTVRFFAPAVEVEGDEIEDLLQKLADYASDAHDAREATAAQLDRIALALDQINEREAGREALGPASPAMLPWPPRIAVDDGVLDLFKDD